MQTIYFMDTVMPIPSDISTLKNLKEIKELDVSQLDTSYTEAVLNWANSEFKKIFRAKKVQTEFDFSNIAISFFQSNHYNTPEAFFHSQKGLVAIKLASYNNGSESNIQMSTLHELTHVGTGSHSLVGLALAEGVAIYLEKLYCEVNEIPDDNEDKRDEGYKFSTYLTKAILMQVYDNDLNMFLERIKRGNENQFIEDVNNYLKSKNILYSANELLRLSSILFYAKNMPSSPLAPYKKNPEMEMLRGEVLDYFYPRVKQTDIIIDEYHDTIKYITSLCSNLKNKISDFEVFSTTLDRELGLALAKDGSKLLLDIQIVNDIIRNVFRIMKLDEKILDMFLVDPESPGIKQL